MSIVKDLVDIGRKLESLEKLYKDLESEYKQLQYMSYINNTEVREELKRLSLILKSQEPKRGSGGGWISFAE